MIVDDTIQTFGGRYVRPLEPRAADVAIEDIAHALAHQCRYGGHVHRFYSVAQHSVLVSLTCPPEAALWGLLHDAAEAYLVDLPSPMKRELKPYQRAEDRWTRAIAERFGLPLPIPRAVHEADRRILVDEMRQLMRDPAPASLGDGLGIAIVPMAPEVARGAFLNRFFALTGGRA
jgi:hypothetical protein